MKNIQGFFIPSKNTNFSLWEILIPTFLSLDWTFNEANLHEAVVNASE